MLWLHTQSHSTVSSNQAGGISTRGEQSAYHASNLYFPFCLMPTSLLPGPSSHTNLSLFVLFSLLVQYFLFFCCICYLCFLSFCFLFFVLCFFFLFSFSFFFISSFFFFVPSRCSFSLVQFSYVLQSFDPCSLQLVKKGYLISNFPFFVPRQTYAPKRQFDRQQ